MTESSSLPPSAQPPAPPRELNRRGSRRAWVEPRVRVWWSSAALLGIIGAYFVINQVHASTHDRQLIGNGRKVRAVITAIDGKPQRDRIVSVSENLSFDLSFRADGGELQIVRARLTEPHHPDGPKLKTLRMNSEVALYVNAARFKNWDKEDAALWSDRQEAPLREDLLLGMMILPFVNLLLIIAVVQRIRIMRVWRDGQAMAAVVLDIRQTASAPFSRVVRFALRDLRNKRVLRAVVPTRVVQFKPGDVFWVVASVDRPQNAIVAALYQ